MKFSQNGEQIYPDEQMTFLHDNQTLQIKYLLGKDSGEYKCRGKNAHGTVERSIKIAVKGKIKTNRTNRKEKSNPQEIFQ